MTLFGWRHGVTSCDPRIIYYPWVLMGRLFGALLSCVILMGAGLDSWSFLKVPQEQSRKATWLPLKDVLQLRMVLVYVLSDLTVSGWWFGTFGLLFHAVEYNWLYIYIYVFLEVETTNHLLFPQWFLQLLYHSHMIPFMVFWLVVWNMTFIFPYIGNVIISIDQYLFRGVAQPPTRFIDYP